MQSQFTSRIAVDLSGVGHVLPLGEKQLRILSGITLQVQRGEWVALTGPSGSGKSTLLGIIAGLDTPTEGRVVVDGNDITRLGERDLARIRNRSVGVVFQSFNLIPTLTALENVEVPLFVGSGGKVRERARRALELVGLADRLHHQPHQLSGGQQQRVAIARAIVTEPQLLLADEPTGNLDSRTSAQILALFAELRERLGVTLIVATHDAQVAAMAGREIHLVDGQIADLPLTAAEGAAAAPRGRA